jgi:hypothetical protein
MKEGFSWPAFFFTILWSFWHRLWIVTIFIIFVQAALYVLINFIQVSHLSQGVILLGLTIIFGFVANEFHQIKLSKEGFELFAIVEGKNKGQAFDHFLRYYPALATEINK